MSEIIYESDACKLIKEDDGDLTFQLEDATESLAWNWLKDEVDSAQLALDKHEESLEEGFL